MTIRQVLRLVHAVVGVIAFVVIACFLTATIRAEISGNAPAIIAAKAWIVAKLPFLIVALVLTGATGAVLTGGKPRGLAARKLLRMKIAAPNGLLILIPAALFLEWKAQRAEFDAAFYAVQVLELVAGTLNLVLFALNIRDGLKMCGRFRRAA
ncbi:hypothetical protein [Methylorubrum zatmanii]